MVHPTDRQRAVVNPHHLSNPGSRDSGFEIPRFGISIPVIWDFQILVVEGLKSSKLGFVMTLGFTHDQHAKMSMK